MRMDRRVGLVGVAPTVPLAELFADISPLAYKGQGTYSISSMTMDISSIDTSTPFYIIYSRGIDIIFNKVADGIVTALYYSPWNYSPTLSGTTLTWNSNSAFGHSAALVRFPNHSERVVDATLRKITAVQKAYTSARTPAQVSFPASELVSDAIYYGGFGDDRTGNSGMSIGLGSTLSSSSSIFAMNNNGVYSGGYVYQAGSYIILADGSSISMGNITQLT